MFKKTLLYTTLLFAAVFASCKSGSKTTASPATSNSSKQNPIQLVRYTEAYFNASREKMLGNVEEAVNLYKQCIKINPDEASPYYELATILTNQNKYADALQLSRKAAELNPKNEWFLYLYAGLLERTKQFDEASRVFQKLIKLEPGKVDYKYELADCYINGGKLKDTIEIYDELEKIFGVSEELIVQKEKLYIKTGNFDKAVSEVKKLVSSNPLETRYLHILAELYSANSKNEEAFEIYKEILRVDSNDPYVHLSLADYYRNKKDNDKGYDELKLAFENQGLDIDIKIKILLSYYTLTESDNTLKNQAFELSHILNA